MEIINFPLYEDYWANGTLMEQTACLMPVKRFKSLRRLIHFSNNGDKLKILQTDTTRSAPLLKKYDIIFESITPRTAIL